VHPVPDPLLLRKCGRAGNRTRDLGSVARNCIYIYIFKETLLKNISVFHASDRHSSQSALKAFINLFPSCFQNLCTDLSLLKILQVQ
jgi:hypothetical protein